MLRPTASGVALTVALAAACADAGPSGVDYLRLAPILDSLYVGDTLAPPYTVSHITAAGDTQPPGALAWTSAVPAVASVNAVTGEVVGVGPGVTIITASQGGVSGQALVVVTRPLDVALLLDTLFLMPGDTLTVPVEVRHRDGPPPAPSFSLPSQAVVSVDAASGLLTSSAGAAGGPFALLVHADTVSDSGAVIVRTRSDTATGAGYYTLSGTVIRRQHASGRAVTYRRSDDTLATRVNLFLPSPSGNVENVIVTLRHAVNGPGVYAIDSLSPAEAFDPGEDAVCRPPRSWGLWSSRAFFPSLVALSRLGGTLAITRVDTVPGGLVVGGRFAFPAHRTDLYAEPLGVVIVRATFVVPLVTDLDFCFS